jgi:CHAT domain-containing protein/Flp pilus assembly protein TadD
MPRATRFLLVLLVLAAPPTAAAKEPPAVPAAAALTPAQQKRLKERDALLRESEVSRSQRNWTRAIAARNKALAIEREVLGDSHPDIADSLSNLAEMSEEAADFPAAAQYFQRALEMKTQILGEKHWKTIDARLDLNDCQHLAKSTLEERSRLRDAEDAFLEARKLHRHNKFHEALPRAEKALNTRKELLGEKHHLVADSLDQIGVIVWNLQDYPRAEKLYQEALKLRKEIHGERHPSVATTLANLGALCMTRGELKDAETYLQSALAIGQETDPEGRQFSADLCLNSMAQLHTSRYEFEKAEELLRQALAQRQRTRGATDPEYRHLLSNLDTVLSAVAQQQIQRKDYAAGRRVQWERLTIRAELYGDDDWKVSDARMDWERADERVRLTAEQQASLEAASKSFREAAELARKGDADTALPKLREVLRVRSEILGPSYISCADVMIGLSVMHREKKDMALAEQTARAALEIYRKSVGEKHPVYAGALRSLASARCVTGAPEEAVLQLRQAVAIYRATVGAGAAEYRQALDELARALEDCAQDAAKSGQLLRARQRGRELLDVVKERGAERAAKRSEVSEALKGLDRELLTRSNELRRKASASYKRGRPNEAIRPTEEAAAIYLEVLGENHPDYAATLQSLGSYHSDAGNFAQAADLFRRALELQRRYQGEKTESYADTLNSLGLLHRHTGDPAGAQPFYREALEIIGATKGGKDDPFYATLLNNLAYTYQALGDPASALPLHEKAVAIREKVLGKDHPDYAQSLNNIGLLHLAMHAYDKAEDCLQTALAVRKKALPDGHPLIAQSMTNLALLFQATGKLSRAEPLLRQALETLQRGAAADDPGVLQAQHNLALLYLWMKEPARGEPLARDMVLAARRKRDRAAPAQSERQQLASVLALQPHLDLYNSIALAAGVPAEGQYDEILLWRGCVSERQRALRKARPNSAEELAEAKLYASLEQTTHQLTAVCQVASSQRSTRWRENLLPLCGELERQEQALAAARANAMTSASVPRTSEAVAKNLPAAVALVDLVSVPDDSIPPDENAKNKGDDMLVAFVTTSGRKVVRINLGPAAPISSAVTDWLREGKARNLVEQARVGAQLRKLMWVPLEPHLGAVQTVLVSADGLLARIPLGALPGKEPNTYLIEEKTFVAISPWQLRELQDGPIPKHVPASLLIVSDEEKDARDISPRSSGSPLWEQFRAAFTTRFPDSPVRVVAGRDATSDGIARELARNRWVYLEIDAYFTPIEDAFPKMSREDLARLPPGLRSGLRVPPHRDANGKSGSPGATLCALEVSDLDLKGLDLLVLPATKATEGVDVRGEGVLSLQRAFHLAGARTVVTTLWEVGETSNRLVLAEFARNLRKGTMSRAEALRAAQVAALRHERKDQPTAPFSWGAFLLSGDWR